VVAVTGSGFGSFEQVKLAFIDAVNGIHPLARRLRTPPAI